MNANGYEHLTLEAVAKRAGTSRPVLGRRWQNRSHLVFAAIARFAVLNPITVPDLGDLRAELLDLLRKTVERSSPKRIRLIYEMHKELAAEESSFADLRSRMAGSDYPTQQILDRAIARGEVAPTRITQRLLRLPIDLARHEMLIHFQPLTEAEIAEIIDDIVLPIWRGV